MSVVSSRVSTISSILQSGVRAQILGQQNRVRFKLPNDLKIVLNNYETGVDRKSYEELICILRDTDVKDSDFLELLTDARQCVTILGPIHKLFIQVILKIPWTHREPNVISAYKGFLEDLVCVHIYHTKFVIDKLVQQFRPTSNELWEDGKCSEEDACRLHHIHSVLQKFLKIIPMSSEILLFSLKSHYPHITHDTHVHEVYVYALLQILDYAPQLRTELLTLMIDRFTNLDVSTPTVNQDDSSEEDEMDVEGEVDGGVFQMDKETEQRKKQTQLHLLSLRKLDICMEQMYHYVHSKCYQSGTLIVESLESIYPELLQTFEKLILPTHASHHVQFIMFYVCSFKSSVVENFIDWLWRRVSNPNIAPVLRQTAICYISSLIVRANFVERKVTKKILFHISNWIHSYIASQDSMECANSDVRVHTVFYAVCQGLFYIIAAKHKDIIVDMKRDLLFLQELNLMKIVSCKLNPLKACLTSVVQNFAAVTRSYQLAYCYSLIEHNSRTNLPVIHRNNRFADHLLNTFFPFDVYHLDMSRHRIGPIYKQHLVLAMVDEQQPRNDREDDDFMDEQFSKTPEAIINKFSYSTSPGFINF